MSTTLLTGVNDLLKRVGEISGDAGELTTLTDGPRQKHIDRAIQIYNEAIITMYDLTSTPMPNELAEVDIVLLTGVREYALPDNLVKMNWPIQDRSGGYYIIEYPGGYMQMQFDQETSANYTGRPGGGAIRPTDGYLYLDRIPTSEENGETFTAMYDKSLLMSVATDTFPFNDTIYTMARAAVAEVWMRYSHKDFDKGLFRSALATAASMLNPNQRSKQWTRGRQTQPSLNSSDPYNG